MLTAVGVADCLQACVVYVLRVGIFSQMNEAAQRLVLDRLTGVSASTTAIPVAIASMQGMGILLETWGEVPDDVLKMLEACILAKVRSDSTAVRFQAAAVLAALALAQPAAASGLLRSCLETLQVRGCHD